MSRVFLIEEKVVLRVEADSAEEALDAWLQLGEESPGYAFQSVESRSVFNEDGTSTEVVES